MSDNLDKTIELIERGTRWRIAKTTAMLSAPALVVGSVCLLLSVPLIGCAMAIIATGDLTCAIARWKWRLP